MPARAEFRNDDMNQFTTDMPMSDVPPDGARDQAPVTLFERAYLALLTMIQNRSLPAGAPIIEQQVANQLGVSRTPLRQALQKLESEGLLVKTANRSFHVRKVELREYLHSLRVRELLEAEAAALSVERVDPAAIRTARANLRIVQARRPYDKLAHWQSDDEVHNLFILNCGNSVMTDMLLSLRVTTKLFEIERLSERLGPDSRQHEEILDALEASDAKAARKAVARHIRSLFQFAVETIG